MLNVPAPLALWTPDQVAECLSGIKPATYGELWGVLDNPDFSPRSLGGDGSEGTSEVPDDFSGNMKDAWKFLSDDAKQNIVDAALANLNWWGSMGGN